MAKRVAVRRTELGVSRMHLRRVFPVAALAAFSGFGVANCFGQLGFVNWETPHVHPLALSPSGATLAAVNTADNRLEVFTIGADGLPVFNRSIKVGLDPVSVRFRSDTEAWVVNHISDSISVVDIATGRVVRTIATGDEPCDVVFAGNPLRAYVSISQLNHVRVYDPANPAAAPLVLPIEGEEPRALAVSPDGTRVYAAIFESGNATGVIRQQDVSNPAGPYAGQNPPPNSGNTFDPPIAPGLPPAPPVAHIVRRSPGNQWLDDNGRNWSSFVSWNVHDHDVAIIHTSNNALTYANGMLTTVMAIGVRLDGLVSIIGTEAMNELRFEPNVNGIFIRAEMGLFAAASPSNPSVFDLNPHLTYTSPTIPASERERSVGDPRAIAWSPDGSRAFIAGMGSDNVVLMDAAGQRLGRIDVGQGPTGLAMSQDGALLYVLNKFDGSISTIDAAALAELDRAAFFDPTPGSISEGRPLLYSTHLTSGLGQASCASCHIDARSDFLAWDLGDPSGVLKQINQPCIQAPNCTPWHPMKGPMVTQTLQGIVGNGPMHWRGDRENIAAFAPAYTGLQGDDAAPSAADMQRLTDFIASIRYPANPNRNTDNTMPANVPVSGGASGNPNSGLNLYLTLPVLPGGARCVTCHALPTGTDGRLDDPPLALSPQTLKISQLRGMNEKVGWNRNSQINSKGTGFNHHSEFDTLNALLSVGFNFGPPGPQTTQRRRDVEAFLLCFDTETHPAIGQQVTFDGTNNTNPQDTERLNLFVTLANSGVVRLVAHGVQGGLSRGWVYQGGGVMQSDRQTESTTDVALRLAAAPGAEITFTVVPAGTQRRIGIDRDADGHLDRDELDAGSDPADPNSVPPCRADFNGDDGVDDLDITAFFAAFEQGESSADVNGDDGIDDLDITAFFTAFEAGC